MQIWKMLLRYGNWRLLGSVLAGMGGGAAFAALMRLVHRALTLPRTEVTASACEFLGLLAVYFCGTVTAEHAMNDAGERLQWELRYNLMRQLLLTPLRKLEKAGVPTLFHLVGGQVKVLADYLTWLPIAVVDSSIAVGCLAYIAWLSPPVFFLNIGFLAVAASCYLLPQRAAQRVGRQAAAAWNQHIGQAHFSLWGARLLILSRSKRADFFRRHFIPSGAELRRLNVRHRLIHLLSERFSELMVLGNVGCLLFLLPRVMDLSAATLTGLLLAAVFVRSPLKSLLDVIPRTHTVGLALEQMRAAQLDPFLAPLPEARSESPRGSFTALELSSVTYQYEHDHGQPGFSCGPFSLVVGAGEVIFVVGGNGAGKTTLAKLLCGLYPPASGTITLDGTCIRTESDRTGLRDYFSAVFMEDPLFEHVLGVEPSEAETRGSELLKELQLAHKVRLDGTAFSTTDLSQGQRRRLMLLGSLLEDRPILLLDEWAAEQDPQFREFFYETMLAKLKAEGRTVIVITHDDRFFDRADRVVKLESGQLVQPAMAS